MMDDIKALSQEGNYWCYWDTALLYTEVDEADGTWHMHRVCPVCARRYTRYGDYLPNA